MKKKILFVTSSRAEYGIIKNVIYIFNKDKYFINYILITGSHLESKFGNTYKEIEKDEELSIKEIFEKKGENYFREIESKYLLRKSESAVVSCGGGIILNKKNREFFKNNGYTIYLKASIPVLETRLFNKNNRPLINKNNLQKSLKKLLISLI